MNERDEETDTPLMAAAEWDLEEAITILLDAGADIDAVNRVGLVWIRVLPAHSHKQRASQQTSSC